MGTTRLLMTMTARELRGAPVVPAALTILIALAVALAGGAGFLLMGVSSAADRLLDQARSPDLVQMHTGAVDPASIRDWAAGRPEIREAGVAELLTLRGQDLVIDGHDRASSTQQSSLTVPDQQRDMLLDLEGAPLGVPERGTVSLPVHHRISGAASVGDEVRIVDGQGWELLLTVAGFHRDAAMSTPISSSERLAVHPADLAEAAPHVGTPEHLVEMWLHDPADAGAVGADYLSAGLPQNGPMVDRSTFLLLSMIGEGLPAALVLLAAAVLAGIGILCLHLAVLTALRRSLRQVGVLAALGIPRREIRMIQAAPFAAIGLLGAGLGTVGGWGLGLLLLRPAGAYLGPVSGIAPWLAAPIAAVLTLLLVLATVHLALRGIGRTGVITALRARGVEPGDGRLRAAASRRLSLQRAGGPLSLRLGLLAAVQRAGTVVLLAAVLVGAVLVMVTPLRAASTLGSPTVIGSLGITPADLLVDDVEAADAEPAAAALREDPVVAEAVAVTSQRASVPDADGLPVPAVVLAGDHTRLPVELARGRAPAAPGEIALSLLLLSDTGLAVGDTVTVTGSGDDGAGTTLRIVGAYQDITQGGRTARTPQAVPGAPVVDHLLSVALVPGADPAPVMQRISAELPGARVLAVDTYREQLLGPIAQRMRTAALLAGAAALALAALVTVMSLRLERAVAAREAAIHRAVGVPAGVLRRAAAVPVALALVVALPLGAAASGVIGQGLLDLVLEGMYGGFAAIGQGASALPLHTAPLLTAVLAPAALLLVIGAATWAGTRDPQPATRDDERGPGMIPGTTPRRTVLRARGLHRRIAGRTLLDGVDLDLAPGEMLAVVGASGSGKSSLLHALGTLDPPDAGRVELDGEDLLALSEAAQARARLHRLGVVFQQFHLLSGLSLLDNVLLPGLAAGGRPRTAMVDRARTLLAEAGVGELAERRITEASGGQLQRVAICRALINAPRVLLADEPTGALDAEATRTVLSLLSRVRDQGTAILMVTHDPAVAGRADRMQEMVDGRLRAA